MNPFNVCGIKRDSNQDLLLWFICALHAPYHSELLEHSLVACSPDDLRWLKYLCFTCFSFGSGVQLDDTCVHTYKHISIHKFMSKLWVTFDFNANKCVSQTRIQRELAHQLLLLLFPRFLMVSFCAYMRISRAYSVECRPKSEIRNVRVYFYWLGGNSVLNVPYCCYCFSIIFRGRF